MQDNVRVAIVGGGRTGGPLLVDFLARPFIDVVLVCDRDPESKGALRAKQLGIPFTADIDEVVDRADEIDLIIEVTGSTEVKPRLKQGLAARDNESTIIVHELVARLILSLAADAHTLVPSLHPMDVGIGLTLDEWSEGSGCDLDEDETRSAG